MTDTEMSFVAQANVFKTVMEMLYVLKHEAQSVPLINIGMLFAARLHLEVAQSIATEMSFVGQANVFKTAIGMSYVLKHEAQSVPLINIGMLFAARLHLEVAQSIATEMSFVAQANVFKTAMEMLYVLKHEAQSVPLINIGMLFAARLHLEVVELTATDQLFVINKLAIDLPHRNKDEEFQTA